MAEVALLILSLADAFAGCEPELLDDDLELELGTEDLPDAYRGCPVHPVDERASIIAVWSPEAAAFVFFRILALVYGMDQNVHLLNLLKYFLVLYHLLNILIRLCHLLVVSPVQLRQLVTIL